MSEVPDQPTDARERLLSHFKGDEAEYGSKWDELWKEGFLPWDKGFPSPALVDLLAERQDLFEEAPKGRRRKALVPGCGKGYDVLLLSAHGYDAYGLEISGKALDAAKQNEKDTLGDDIYKAKKGVEKGTVTWLEGDFFNDDFLKNVERGGVFDLIYDYTFLCALPPSLRPAWSARQAQLLAPEGRLVCLEFPTYKPPSTGGPPWALPPKIYEAHLPRPGVRIPYGEDGSLQDDKLGKPSHLGLQRLVHFQPARTHKIGYNAEGKVTDWVSVWSHPKNPS